MKLRRWTPLTFLLPSRYVDTGEFWEDFELEEWANGLYDWTQDPWNGFRDFATPPMQTVRDGQGDCEDFALVALSWAVANDRSGLGLGFCWESNRPWPTHVIAYDEGYVYSSGDIDSATVDEWLEESRYSFVLRRRVS